MHSSTLQPKVIDIKEDKLIHLSLNLLPFHNVHGVLKAGILK